MILPSGLELLSGMSMYCDVSAEVYRQRACKRCLQHEGMMRCMCGPNDFVPIGTMRKYDRLHTLPRLTMPTLFHGGQWDEAVQQPVEAYSQLRRDGHFAMAENSGHLTLGADRFGTTGVIREFLADADFLPGSRSNESFATRVDCASSRLATAKASFGCSGAFSHRVAKWPRLRPMVSTRTTQVCC